VAGNGGGRSTQIKPPSAITSGCIQMIGRKTSATHAATAINPVATSRTSDRAMPSTACATMATATSFNACATACPAGVANHASPPATASIKIADGAVNPSHAATPPRGPPRFSPSAKPT